MLLGKRDKSFGQFVRSLGFASVKAHTSHPLNRQSEHVGEIELTGAAQRLVAQPESLIRFPERDLD